MSGPPSTGASNVGPQQTVTQRPAHAREYSFLDIELKYGILQVSRENLWQLFIKSSHR